MDIRIPEPAAVPEPKISMATLSLGGRDIAIDVWSLLDRTDYDFSDRFYVPERDPRWSFRARALIKHPPPVTPVRYRTNETYMEYGGHYPVKVINGKPNGVMFVGKPKLIEIKSGMESKKWIMPMGKARACFGGKMLLAFGGPGHEVIIDDQWYNIPFNGKERPVVTSAWGILKVRLFGGTPPVKDLGEVKTPAEVALIRRCDYRSHVQTAQRRSGLSTAAGGRGAHISSSRWHRVADNDHTHRPSRDCSADHRETSIEWRRHSSHSSHDSRSHGHHLRSPARGGHGRPDQNERDRGYMSRSDPRQQLRRYRDSIRRARAFSIIPSERFRKRDGRL